MRGFRAFSVPLLFVLPIAPLILWGGSAEAVISSGEAKACTDEELACHDACGKDCKGNKICLTICGSKCQSEQKQCLVDADKDAPVPFTPKVQPNVRPGEAEVPGTESPNAPPTGGVQQQP
jgi:hypothetical protein